jgi:cathepsin B
VTGEELGGHAIKIIGYGTDSDSGLKYWLVANSWNTIWGEKGFFRIVKGSNECGIEENGMAGLASSD